MKNLVVNETPLRTSKNFMINNVVLDDFEVPNNTREFKNISISGNGYVLDKNIDKANLKYGVGKVLENNVIENANNVIGLSCEDKGKVKITYDFDDDNLNLLNFVQLDVKGNLDLIIEYKSNTNKKCFHNGIIKLFASENSCISVTIVNFMNNISENLESIENVLKENSNVNYMIVDMGGKRSISNYYSNILGNCAKNDLKTVYLANDDEFKDINYIVELRGEKTQAYIDVQGALNDNSKKNFKGTIDFKKGAKKAKGNENEYCMILSDNAKSIALPMLLCTEDDVEGNHSTASGKVEEEKLFYIMSRGFSYKEAIKLIIKANFDKILNQINDEQLKEKISYEIDRRLD